MRGIRKFSKTYFLKYSEKAVKIKPYNPLTGEIALEYCKIVDALLQEFGLHSKVKGSTAYKIAGKGDIEIGVFPGAKLWPQVIEKLTTHYLKVANMEPNYCRFEDQFRGHEIEIICLKGHDAKVDQALSQYLLSHAQALKEYEQLKLKYCYSKREYTIQKDKFFREIIARI